MVKSALNFHKKSIFYNDKGGVGVQKSIKNDNVILKLPLVFDFELPECQMGVMFLSNKKGQSLLHDRKYIPETAKQSPQRTLGLNPTEENFLSSRVVRVCTRCKNVQSKL